MDAKELLQHHFGHDTFRGDQEAVISCAVSQKSCMVLMPTGMGKSACFQIPSKILSGTVLVLSPLIALMKDQVDQALKRGFRAAFINSTLSREERQARYRNLARGDYEILYVTPERFQIPEFCEAIKDCRVSLLAIDEAHCISEWGHDFRPDYTRIQEIRALLGMPPVMALTATATPDVQEDILRQCGLDPENTTVFRHGLERKNLSLSVVPTFEWGEKIRFIYSFHKHYPGPKIVYLLLVQSLEKLARELDRLNLSFCVYHGDLGPAQRRRNQERFIQNEEELILATPAFGLGIDKPDIRAVLHAEMPGSLEAYYQEVGRAGRDGQPAKGILLYDESDATISMDFIKWANPDPDFIVHVYELIRRNPVRFEHEGLEFLREQMNFYNRRDFRVETCVQLLERWGNLVSVSDKRGQGWTLGPAPEGGWLSKEHYEKRMRLKNEKLLKVIQYSQGSVCRMKTIMDYFGLVSSECGECDMCTQRGPL